MTAELLRRAASEMRARAEGADPSPWDAEEPDIVGSGLSWVVYATSGEHERSIPHIASWHPAVALAVADWLDWVADDVFDADIRAAGNDFAAGCDCSNCAILRPALAVARAYLGEA